MELREVVARAAYISLPDAQAALEAIEQAGFRIVPVELIEDLCSELEAEVKDRWGYDERLKHKLDRDMQTVNKARAMIAAAKGG